MSDQGLMLVISGPSGVGKTTITHHVEKQLDAQFSVSLTTRPQREGDTEGVDYCFVSLEEFAQQRDAGELLEYAEVFGNWYGTPRAPMDAALAKGRVSILEIDVEGAVQIKEKVPQAFSMFVLPPSEQALLNRLRARATDEESVI
ncbi:MAG: guanylate kinase, partial [Phycisphaeraceae bacterium]|nr:guanylate kinase [Phycisphaeraceae bacterium]